MRLIKLTITNFGVFQGENVFDLEPKHGSIVLFGGKNGSGKTTILDGIRLCLYGSKSLSLKASKKEYDNYITKKIHHRRKTIVPIGQASITLQFEYAIFGNRQEYQVTREWTKKGSSITETLILKKNGKNIDDLAEERWQDLIDDFIPLGVSSLFFFDGEKIQSLASDSLSEQILGNEVKGLFGLNVIEKLQSDLDMYIYRQRKDGVSNDLISSVDSAKETRDAIEEDYMAARQDRSQTESYISFTRNKIDELEKIISVESSGFGSLRVKLRTELAQVENFIAQHEKAIQDLCSGLLPFALVPELNSVLQKQLLSEIEYQQWIASKNVVTPRIGKIKERLESDDLYRIANINIDHQTKKNIVTQISLMLDEIVDAPELVSSVQIRHHLSESERYQLSSWITTATIELPGKLKKISDQLEQAENKRLAIQLQLRKVPDEELIKPLMDELSKLYQKLGELEAIASQQETKLSQLTSRKHEAQRDLQKSYEALREGESLENRLGLVSKVYRTLDKFQKRLTNEKIEQLQSLITARFNELIRKPDLVNRVSVDPVEFRITLYNKDDQEVHKDGLSAGEKQILAVAVLWALRQLSGRPFPVIVDTPLGRLDSEHRDNLIENYFPRISHQVVLFSTDTEVDKNYFKALEPYISHTYHLVYDPSISATKIEAGYFWENN